MGKDTKVVADAQERGLGAWFRKLFRREDPEVLRRRWLLQHGRIVEGLILDMIQDGRSVALTTINLGAFCTVSYRYHVSGVTYESTQNLNADQMANIKAYLVGCRVSVRYDPRRPANAMIV
ncbi:MAG: DUF3592 domain-containing protein [Blastocatellia bacterium]|nr:DUF3592 domain-containing protein [Blastocatellia bacterium]